MNKRASRQVKIGNKIIGGGAPVLVQSMLNAPATTYVCWKFRPVCR